MPTEKATVTDAAIFVEQVHDVRHPGPFITRYRPTICKEIVQRDVHGVGRSINNDCSLSLPPIVQTKQLNKTIIIQLLNYTSERQDHLDTIYSH